MARLRRDAGLPGLSLGWGPWVPLDGGMTGELSERDLERMSRSGTPRSPSNRAWPCSTPLSPCPAPPSSPSAWTWPPCGAGARCPRSCAAWSAPAPAARYAPAPRQPLASPSGSPGSTSRPVRRPSSTWCATGRPPSSATPRPPTSTPNAPSRISGSTP
ncbi:hypothetical protein ACFQVA_01410 [Actinomadura keratinilytica]